MSLGSPFSAKEAKLDATDAALSGSPMKEPHTFASSSGGTQPGIACLESRFFSYVLYG